jgi:WD40 repeat protein
MDLQTLDLPSRILLSTSTSFEHITSPRATTSSSFQDYVLNLACLDSCYAASFSPPSNSILLLDKERLRLINSLKAHSDAITLIRNGRNLASFDGTSVLISSGRDGLVKVWDPRSPKGSVVQCWWLRLFYHRRCLRLALSAECEFDLEYSCLCISTPPLYLVDANRGILSFDISSDGQTLATGTELRSDEAHLVFWCGQPTTF